MNKVLVLIKANTDEISPFDEASLEVALSLKNCEVKILSMGPIQTKERLQTLTRLGCKATLVSDKAYVASDTIATAKILSKAILREKPDFIFMGKKSLDGDTGQVPVMVSELTSFSLVNSIVEVKKNSYKCRNGKTGEFKNNTIYVFEKVTSLRFPKIGSKALEIELINNDVLNLQKSEVGFDGSPTRVIKTIDSNDDRRFVKWIDKNAFYNLLNSNTKSNIKTKKYTGKKVEKIYYVGDIKNIASLYAEKTEKLDVKNVSNFVNNIPGDAKVILFESNEEIKEFASRVAIKLGYGLTADCTDFSFENDNFVMIRPTFGGQKMAHVISQSPISLATVSKVKITNDIVFGVGMGAISCLPAIKKLAKTVNASIVATRNVVDAQIMPYISQVGLTGKTIAPKIYVSFGISGQIQHVVGISRAGTIISINNDKNANIFDYSDYGICANIKEILC